MIWPVAGLIVNFSVYLVSGQLLLLCGLFFSYWFHIATGFFPLAFSFVRSDLHTFFFIIEIYVVNWLKDVLTPCNQTVWHHTNYTQLLLWTIICCCMYSLLLRGWLHCYYCYCCMYNVFFNCRWYDLIFRSFRCLLFLFNYN